MAVISAHSMRAHESLEWCCGDGSTIPLIPILFAGQPSRRRCVCIDGCSSSDRLDNADCTFPLGDFLGHRNSLVAELHRCVLASGSGRLEGNCLCALEHISGHDGSTASTRDACKTATGLRCTQFVVKRGRKTTVRNNLFVLGGRCRSILEVGFNAGHSAALLLFAGDASVEPTESVVKQHELGKRSYVGIDTCEHKYTSRCFEALQKAYGGEVAMTLLVGDSRDVLPKYCCTVDGGFFDFIHIDGGHSSRVARADLLNCKRFAGRETLVCVDDSHMKDVKKLLEEFTRNGILVEVNYKELCLTSTPVQRVFRYHTPLNYVSQ